MITLAPQVRVFLCSETVDMKKSFDGLVAIIESAMGQDPLSGSLFVFFNRRREGQTLTGYLWAGIGDARRPYDCFVSTSSRSCVGPEAFLQGFQGYWVADAHIAYVRIGKLWPGVLKATCWIHARRGFEACHKQGPTIGSPSTLNIFFPNACRKPTIARCALAKNARSVDVAPRDSRNAHWNPLP
jgi:hypothetical protein